MIRVSHSIKDVPELHNGKPTDITTAILLFTIMLFYILAALIRLAYFNVMEEERQQKEDGVRKHFQGLPVTSAALIFPTVLLFQFILPADITPVYFAVMIVTAILFVLNVRIPKPGIRGILILIGLGMAEFVAFAIAWFSHR